MPAFSRQSGSGSGGLRLQGTSSFPKGKWSRRRKQQPSVLLMSVCLNNHNNFSSRSRFLGTTSGSYSLLLDITDKGRVLLPSLAPLRQVMTRRRRGTHQLRTLMTRRPRSSYGDAAVMTAVAQEWKARVPACVGCSSRGRNFRTHTHIAR